MVEKRLARHNVVAVLETFDGGRDALEELRDAGIGTEALSLLGPEHEMRPGQGRVSESPGTTTTGIGKAALGGIGAGTVGGGVLGALAGAAVTAIPGVGLAVGAGALYAGIAGAATGQIAGGLLGAEAGGRKSMMWAQSLQPFVARVRQEDKVLVGVHTEDLEQADRAQEILEDLDTVDVIRLDADESFIPPGDAAAVAGRSIPSSVPDQPGADLGRDQTGEDAPVIGMAERGEGATDPARQDDDTPPSESRGD